MDWVGDMNRVTRRISRNRNRKTMLARTAKPFARNLAVSARPPRVLIILSLRIPRVLPWHSPSLFACAVLFCWTPPTPTCKPGETRHALRSCTQIECAHPVGWKIACGWSCSSSSGNWSNLVAGQADTDSNFLCRGPRLPPSNSVASRSLYSVPLVALASPYPSSWSWTPRSLSFPASTLPPWHLVIFCFQLCAFIPKSSLWHWRTWDIGVMLFMLSLSDYSWQWLPLVRMQSFSLCRSNRPKIG